MNHVIGQKRAGTPLNSTMVKQRQVVTTSRPAGRVARPPVAKDVKFPVVNHKEIQVSFDLFCKFRFFQF